MGSHPSQDVGPGEPYAGERQTRLSGAWTALVVGVVALVVILVFILQNLQNVELNFLVFHGQLPLAIALLFAVILGAVIILAFGGAASCSFAWLPGGRGIREQAPVHQSSERLRM